MLRYQYDRTRTARLPWSRTLQRTTLCTRSRPAKPLQPKHVWSIRVRLEIAHMWRDLALFNLAIDSKLRAAIWSSSVSMKYAQAHWSGIERQPVQFEITEQTRAFIEVWLRMLRTTGSRYLFPSRLHTRPHLSTRQYARLVHRWADTIGLKSIFYGTHSMRRTKVTQSIARPATFVPSSFYSVIQTGEHRPLSRG